ncbi:MAG TPA: wax ester/triacylglycerol synthase domain-containing protein [Pseudonocardiaceae bacterium]|nr:wax ester/triacylglycerol synthase domain-containing protein [Pseudonocardiaceae bacterium]
MNGFETMMWRADRILPSPVLAIEQLDTVPRWDRFREVHERVVRTLPRLRQRVVEAPLGLVAPRWSADPTFDLDFHVWRTRMCDGHGWAELFDRAARWALDPFERTHPVWEAVLCEGLPGGRCAYVLKLHHSLADGLGVAQLLEYLHSAVREPNTDTSGIPTVPAARSGVLRAIAGQLRHDVTGVAGMVAVCGAGARDAVSDPVGWVSRASRYGRSLYRTLSPPDAPASPLLARRGRGWRFAALDVPLRELRAAARMAGATLNDTYLAALLGGYRHYHTAMGSQLEAIPMAIPISRRRPGDPAGGNRIAGARLSGPIGIGDPQKRITAIRELVLAARREPAIDTIALMSPVLGRLPGSVTARLVGPMTAGNDLQAGLLPAPRTERYLAGARVERVYPLRPITRLPSNDHYGGPRRHRLRRDQLRPGRVYRTRRIPALSERRVQRGARPATRPRAAHPTQMIPERNCV